MAYKTLKELSVSIDTEGEVTIGEAGLEFRHSISLPSVPVAIAELKAIIEWLEQDERET